METAQKAPVVRAKFLVNDITHRHIGNPEPLVEVRLMPVYNNSPENESWSKWTPQGEIRMTITNPAAIEQFDLGKEYYIDFTPVEG